MLNSILLYASAILVAFWGIAHIFPTKGVVKNFGDISQDNKRIITMEWVVEGINLAFVGLLIVLVTATAGPENEVARLVYWSSAGLLIVLAIWHSLTGARTKAIPMKLCPIIFSTGALLLRLGTLI